MAAEGKDISSWTKLHYRLSRLAQFCSRIVSRKHQEVALSIQDKASCLGKHHAATQDSSTEKKAPRYGFALACLANDIISPPYFRYELLNLV